MVDTNEMTLSLFESRFKHRQYIGSGGFAKVYKAFDHAKNHYVALKVADVRPEYKQFTLQREVELVNKLPAHPNIARYDACYRFDMGVAGEIDFAILKFYEEGNLNQFVAKHTLSSEDVHIIVRGILRGVSFLHSNNYVHRDLKSQNILLQREDGVWTPKITDFGLSRSMGADSTANNSAIALSYSYAAPEQVQNRRIYKNVDIWAVGVIIYKMVTGELPFKSNTSREGRDTQSELEMSRKIVNAELPDRIHSIDEPYQSIIKRCLIADPQQRCQNADELLYLLDGEQAIIGNYHEEEEMMGATLFVPVEPEPEKSPEPEQTEMVQPPAEPEKSAAVVDQHPDFSYQDVSRPAIPPPAKSMAFDTPVYEEPKADYTQIIASQRAATPAPTSTPLLTTGEPDKGLKWWHYLLVLGLIVGATIVYFILNSPSAGNTQGIFEPIPYYEDIRKQNEEAKSNPELLDKIAVDIEKSIKYYPTDYRWPYQLAKNRAYASRGEEALEALSRAGKIAVDSNRGNALANDIARDRQAFERVASGNQVKWQGLLKTLQQ